MKRQVVIDRLTRNGWKVTHDMCGKYIAIKCGRTHIANSINELHNKIK